MVNGVHEPSRTTQDSSSGPVRECSFDGLGAARERSR